MGVPVIANIYAIDASIEYHVQFAYIGNQVFGNQIQVFDNNTGALVYDNEVSSFQLEHLIPANTLLNGNVYNCKIRVFDTNHNYSAYSSPVIFEAHLTPTISIDITNNQVVQNSYLPVSITYTTNDNEMLDSWSLILYDNGKNIIKQTDVILANDSMGTTINQLENSKQYYVEVVGTTVHKMTCTTGLIAFSVTYIEPNAFSKVIAENIAEDGLIKVESHLIDIEGKSQPSPPSFIYGSEVDLSGSQSSVWFDEGFLINGDFTKQYILRNLTPYAVICTLTNGVDTLTIRYMYGDFEEGQRSYFLLEVYNKVFPVRVASDLMNVLDESETVYLVVKRINDLWSIKVYNFSISNDEWNTLGLTVDEWNEKNISNYDLVARGKLLMQ